MTIKKEKLIQTLNQKWLNDKCIMCGFNDWKISGEDVFMIFNYHKDGVLPLHSNKFLPLVSLTCGNCGNTILINPLVLGDVITHEGGISCEIVD